MNRSLEEKINNLSETGYDFDFNLFWKEGLKIFQSYWFGFMAFSSLYLLVSLLLLSVFKSTLIGLLAPAFLQPIFIGGIYLVADKVYYKQSVNYFDFFKIFKLTIPLLALQVVVNLLIVVGALALLIPGIYLGVAMSLASLFLIFKGTDLKTSIQLSIKLINVHWFSFFGLMLIFALVNGILMKFSAPLIVVTIPISSCITYMIFQQLVGTNPPKASQKS